MNEVEQWWNVTDREKQLFSGKNLSQCHFVHHKLDKGRLESNLGLRSEKKASNRLRHGKTSKYTAPIGVAARSKTWICDRSLAGIAGSNPVRA
jgi:hypothetical protein